MKNTTLLLLFFFCSTVLHTRAQNNVDANNKGFMTSEFTLKGNPIFPQNACDVAPLVYGEKLYLLSTHTGSQRANSWQISSTDDMMEWSDPKVVLSISDFKWLPSPCYAWAAELVERKGKFYIYVTVMTPNSFQTLIAVAVADNIEGPYRDAKGSALIAKKNDDGYMRSNFDPKVFIDDDIPYIFWGENQCYYSKLNENMIKLEGKTRKINVPQYKFSPWVHKYNDKYYLSYGQGFPARTAYAYSTSINGPWKYVGVIHDRIPGCLTNQQAIIEFNNEWYFFFHIGKSDAERKICVVRMLHDEKDAIVPIDRSLVPIKVKILE